MELQLPLFETPSSWVPPSCLPDLSDAKEIAIDTENKDPHLKDRGPGYIRKDGFVAGIGIATDTGFSGYYPIGHFAGGNLDRGLVTNWLREVLAKDRDYIFTNAQYDLGWLRTLGLNVGGRIRDISIAATLLDEEAPTGYSLDALGKVYAGRGKKEGLLRAAASNWEVDAKAEMWKLPASLVGPYGEDDPVLTLVVWHKLKALLKDENLWDIFELECQVTPILFEMFWKGIRVDLAYGEQLNARWLIDEREALKSTGLSSDDLWTPAAIHRYCAKHAIQLPRTAPSQNFPEGQLSATKDFLTNLKHPALAPLLRARAINRTRQTFLCDVLLKGNLNGRIHPQYIQLASDEGGTRTGRLAARNPNAQQFPKRSTVFDAKSIRKCLLPEEGRLWAKFDYWSQEPTLQCHYGLLTNLPGAETVRDNFTKRVKLYTTIEQLTGGKCNYDQAKEVVLGRSYGMGAPKMAARMGIDEAKCREILEAFDRGVPFITLLARSVGNTANQRGFIRTILGRHRHFDEWRPRGSKEMPVRGYDNAVRKWTQSADLERCWTYKAFNALIQGSAADMTKKALVDINSAIGTPMMTVHDEISKSVVDEREAKQMKEIMESGIKLLCPVQTDMDLGANWC